MGAPYIYIYDISRLRVNGSRIICSCATLPTSYPAVWPTVCYSMNAEIGHIVGAFAKLLKATVSFVMSVCPSVLWNNSARTGRIFMKFDI